MVTAIKFPVLLKTETMEYSGSVDVEGNGFSVYEYLPLGVLAIESVCAVLCNASILLLFCIRKSLLRTASDLFTINLSLVDLIFSGIVLPIVILTALTSRNKCNDEKTVTSAIEIARNCIVLFGTVATALGTLLVSLDRGDVSLKPSKRFFTQSKAILAIGLTWCISTIGFVVAILPSLLFLDKKDKNLTHNDRTSAYLSLKSKNETTIKYLGSNRYSKCCSLHPCNPWTINGCTVQLIFEIPIFVAAILTIMIIYGRILWSVQRRSKKYMNGTSKHTLSRKESTTSCQSSKNNLCGFNVCCSRRDKCVKTPEKNMHENHSLADENLHIEPPPLRPPLVRKDSFKQKSLNAIKNLTATGHREAKKQDSLEDALFATGKTDESQDTSKKSGDAKEQKKNKTDFASVAMSVTVVLAIKRMAARKIKERKKKIMHLRKMTFFIIFTFLFCWTPYYMSKLYVVVSLHLENSTTFPNNSTIGANTSSLTRRCAYGWMFSWMLAIAALSCILNPILYMFSREKIRLEFVKTFFPSCCGEGRNEQQQQRRQKRIASCLVCWDTDDNIKDRSPSNYRRSVISSRWRNRTAAPSKSKMELKQIPSHGCSREEGTEPSSSSSSEMPKAQVHQTVPLLRWDAIDCEALDDTQEVILDNNAEERGTIGNSSFLLPPANTRPRSMSAKSVDILSCSTTIASLAAEL